MTVRFAPSHVRSALEVAKTEQRRTESEHDAFAEFADRLAALTVPDDTSATVHTQSAAAQTLLQPESQSNNQLAAAHTAYRETVMSVPHYEEEYDESLREHLTGEFTPDIAAALTTGDQLIPSLQDRLITESRQSCTSRRKFLSALEDEVSALQAADERLTELGSEFSDFLATRSLEAWSSEELLTNRRKVRAGERECDELAADRQSNLRAQRFPGIQHIDLEFVIYLYQSLPVTYPVLADITNLAETLRSIRSQIDTEVGLE